jgi:hypothetical protein
MGLRALIDSAAATGSKLWATRYDGAAHMSDCFTALVLNGDGRKVFIAGDSEGATANDLITETYQG